jgi:hypothetical protein
MQLIMISSLKMEVIRCSETLVHIWPIPEDGNFHDYRYQNLESYTLNTVFVPSEHISIALSSTSDLQTS